jgi:hypothetical protein
MIIKSMSRKQASFGQLVDYMEDGRQDIKYTIKHNLYSNKSDEIKKEFESNASFLNKRKNGVYMYHEVVSITKSKQLNDEEQKELLRKIGLQYIEKRANNNLVYGVLHTDKEDNFHYHFLISSNESEESKKHRLSKYDFDKIKKDLENLVLEKYPELEQKKIINKKATEKLSKKGAELKRRTGKNNQRDSVKNRLKTVFNLSQNKQSFFENIKKEKMEIYVRGDSIGIIDLITGRKHRLKTLGMLDDFNKISSIVETSETINKRKEEIQENRKPYKEKITINRNKTSSNSSETVNEVEKTEKEKIIEARKEEIKNQRESKNKNNSSHKNSR